MPPPAAAEGALTALPARAPHTTGNVTVSLTIPYSGQLLCSKSGFISPYTSKLRISVNGSDLPAVKVKTAGPISTTFSAPAGSDRIVVVLHAEDRAISQAAFTVRVSSGQTASVRPKFEGIVEAGTFTTSDPNPPVGHPSTLATKFAAADALNDAICGTYASPVDVEMLGGKPEVTPLAASFSKTGEAVNFTYDGKLSDPSFSLHATSLKSIADLKFTIDPYVITGKTKQTIGKIVAGKNGDVWFNECSDWNSGPCRIGSFSARGNLTESEPIAFVQSVALGPDGNVWFAEGTGGGSAAHYQH
jgi:hypothetical protein